MREQLECIDNCFGMVQEPVQNLRVKIHRQTNMGAVVEYSRGPGVYRGIGPNTV